MRTYQRAWPAFSFSSSGTKVFVQSFWESCILNYWVITDRYRWYQYLLFTYSVYLLSHSLLALFYCITACTILNYIYSHLSRKLGLFKIHACICTELHISFRTHFKINDAFICVIYFLDADGKVVVKFGVLFADDRCANLFEALVGTLRAAKRKKIVTYEGELLLQGVHDNVDIVVL